MNESQPLSREEIIARLDEYLEVEFTFVRSDELAELLLPLKCSDQDFILDWVKRIASTQVELAHQFARNVLRVLNKMDHQTIESWVLYALDSYDRTGLREAMEVIHNVEQFVRLSREREVGVALEDVSGVLLTFVHGLTGRQLKLEQADSAYTDSETLFLPSLVVLLDQKEDNFLLIKAMVVMLWAQTRYGTFCIPLSESFSRYPDPERAARLFHRLETIRLESCIERELPGLYREMLRIKQRLDEDRLSQEWERRTRLLTTPDATVETSMAMVGQLYDLLVPAPTCYQGEFHPEVVASVMAERVEREKMLLKVKLAKMLDEAKTEQEEDEQGKRIFRLKDSDSEQQELGRFELMLDDVPIAPPEAVTRLLTSIQLDLGEIPDEYLTPAGPGEYDPDLYREEKPDMEEVWSGTYHEEGAEFYDEWDCGRQHYRKNWCVMRECNVTPVHDDFVSQTLQKYSSLVKQLRKTFEAMRDEDRLLKRQTNGDGVDIDALVEALADAQDGKEMSDRLFTRMHRSERNIAVIFMVDMSGSTKGWINDAERESLILLCEALESLGDRYAIYGFSGITRKRCDLFRIKEFCESYNDEVQARISGIRAQEYTRMGFAIRHLSRLLNETDARTRILITLSDGKPDDHTDYRGEYGIEDTRRALIEARRSGIHPYCITIDEQARDYLPHLYGPAAYTLVNNVRELPHKVSGIYRRLTT